MQRNTIDKKNLLSLKKEKEKKNPLFKNVPTRIHVSLSKGIDVAWFERKSFSAISSFPKSFKECIRTTNFMYYSDISTVL